MSRPHNKLLNTKSGILEKFSETKCLPLSLSRKENKPESKEESKLNHHLPNKVRNCLMDSPKLMTRN